jgi:hypothetical protein
MLKSEIEKNNNFTKEPKQKLVIKRMWIKSELKEIERTTCNFVLNGEIEKNQFYKRTQNKNRNQKNEG